MCLDCQLRRMHLKLCGLPPPILATSSSPSPHLRIMGELSNTPHLVQKVLLKTTWDQKLLTFVKAVSS